MSMSTKVTRRAKRKRPSRRPARRGYIASKPQLLGRLQRIEGQVRGVARMVEEERYCIDVVTQITAIQAALNKVGLGLLDDHARHCVFANGGARRNRGARAGELMAAVSRFARR